jgi:hypothetical protein
MVKKELENKRKKNNRKKENSFNIYIEAGIVPI